MGLSLRLICPPALLIILIMNWLPLILKLLVFWLTPDLYIQTEQSLWDMNFALSGLVTSHRWPLPTKQVASSKNWGAEKLLQNVVPRRGVGEFDSTAFSSATQFSILWLLTFSLASTTPLRVTTSSDACRLHVPDSLKTLPDTVILLSK